MAELTASEYIQRGGAKLAPVLRGVAETVTPEGHTWPEAYTRRDAKNGVRGRVYSMDDPRFVLRVLDEHHARFGTVLSRLQRNYARELREALNLAAHEPQNQHHDTAERALSTMRLLIRPWNAATAEAELEQLLCALAADNASAPQPASRPDAAELDPSVSQPILSRDDPIAPGSPADNEDLEDGLRRIALKSGPVTVFVTMRERISFALAENGVSPLTEIRVRNDGDDPAAVTGLVIGFSGEDEAYAEPRRINDISVEAHEEIELPPTHLRWPLGREAFAALDEARSVDVYAQAIIDGTERRGSAPVRLLSRDEWSARSIPELIAAFVTPNAPGIADLLGETADILGAATGDPSLQGYQEGPERAVAIGRAAYDALRARRIRYAEPPASFEIVGQKVRSVERVLGERLATCLDLVVLYCAMLEQAGLDPVIVHVPGHAYAGFLTVEKQLSSVALDDRAMIDNLIKSRVFVGVELTAATDGKSATFDAAVASTREWLADPHQDDIDRRIRYLLDVRAAHRRIRPLPRITQQDGVIQIEVEKATPEPVPARRGKTTRAGTAVEPEPVRPRRVENWRSSLLDLSLRNPLLKLKKAGSATVVTTEQSLPLLEDLLAQEHGIELRSGDDIGQIHIAQGKRTAAQLDPATVNDILRSEGAVHLDTTQYRHGSDLDKLRRRSKTVLEETGANSLFLTLGALAWKDAKGSPALAPLFLLPVVLEGRKGRRWEMKAEPDAQVLPNYCLLEKLKRDFGVEIPVLANPPADEAGIDLPEVFESVRQDLLRHQLSFNVEPESRIALIQFSTLEMWRDVTQNWEAFLDNPVVRHLVETPTETFDDPVEKPTIEALDEVRSHLPLPVDGSQLEAVRWATAGRTFVLQGPPGTGKSQTITNIIADALARGRRVLFVAEKQAALQVVRRRLEDVGLGARCLDIHGRDQSIKTVRTQLDRARNAAFSDVRAVITAARQRQEGQIDTLDDYARRLHEPGRAGLSVWQAHQQVLAHQEAAGMDDSLAIPGSVVAGHIDTDSLYTHARHLSDAMRHMSETQNSAAWALVGGDAKVTDVEALTGYLIRLDDALRSLSPSVHALLDHVDERFWTAIHGTLRQLDAGDAYTPTEWRALGTRSALDEAVALDGELNAFLTHFDRMIPLLTSRSENLNTGQTRVSIDEAENRNFFARKKARTGVVNDVLAYFDVPLALDYVELSSFLDSVDQVRQARTDLELRLSRLYGERMDALDPALHSRMQNMQAACRLTERIVDEYPENEPQLEAIVLEQRTHGELANSLAVLLEAWADCVTAFAATPRTLTTWKNGQHLIAAIHESLPVWLDMIGQGRLVPIERMSRVNAELDYFDDVGFTQLAEDLRAGRTTPTGLEERLRGRINRAILEERLESTGLDIFDSGTHATTVDGYRSQSREIRTLLVDDLPTLIGAHHPAAVDGGLLREISRKRGGTIRELFANHGKAVLDLTPCLLASPNSVAKHLPLGAVDIDLVIFDEASQIKVADAVGAMGRATSVVVVGDSKQMPPTAMFATSLETGDDDGDVGGALTPADQESILSETIDANIESLQLSWHYRSQAEELIAFSNEHYYGGNLASFPAPPEPRLGTGVRLQRVDGKFDRGGSRTNRQEAGAIIDTIIQRLHEDPHASIGVVTFNSQQRDLIDDLIDASEDVAIRASRTREDDPLFVKNLENVQGDERDVILFSLAFSPDPETHRLLLNFGPLTAAGGERRLNVAITRARREVVLLASFDPRQIDLDRTNSEGLRHLRAYLLFAEEHEKGNGVTGSSDRDLYRDEVAAALTRAGLEVKSNLGMSSFRVDLAVRCADGPWVAVLLDGPRWAQRRIVADRDDIPEAMLTSHMGWAATTSVWTPAWIRDRETVIAGVIRIAEAAEHPSRVTESAPENAVNIPTPSARTEETAPTQEFHEPALNGTRGGQPEPAPSLGMVDVRTFIAPAEVVTLALATAPDDEHTQVARRADTAAPKPVLAATQPSTHIAKVAFEAASSARRHSLDVLDELERTKNKAILRNELLDILDAEAPIQLDRFMRIAGGRFDLGKTHRNRVEQILSQLPSDYEIRGGGQDAYCWPKAVPSERYRYVRTSIAAVRSIAEIPSEELENAIRLALVGFPLREEEHAQRAAMDFFGFGRFGSSIRAALAAASARLESKGQIRRRGTMISLVGQ